MSGELSEMARRRPDGIARIVSHLARVDEPPKDAADFMPPRATMIPGLALLLVALGGAGWALWHGVSLIVERPRLEVVPPDHTLNIIGIFVVAIAALIVAARTLGALIHRPALRRAYLAIDRGDLGEPSIGSVVRSVSNVDEDIVSYWILIDVDGQRLLFRQPRHYNVRVAQTDLPVMGDLACVWQVADDYYIAQLEPRSFKAKGRSRG